MRTMHSSITKVFHCKKGFTLIEIIIVVTVLSIMGMLVAPRLSSFLGDERKNFKLITGIIAKTYDDAFIHGNNNYLAFHLYEPGAEEGDEDREDVFLRDNAVSVLVRQEGKFIDHSRKSLRFRQFSEDFMLEDVILGSGTKITEGNVLVPFYPQGYSDNVIVHIRTGDDEVWSLRIYKHLKEPDVKYGYRTFDEDEE